MRMILRASFIIITIAIACLACTGCTVQRMTFPNHDPDEVWTAMVAVAQTPDYNHPDYTKRWTVRVNEVWVNPERSQIEIYRRLERVLHRPGSQPLHEE